MFSSLTIAVDMSSATKFVEKINVRRLITSNGGYMTFNVSKEVSG